MLKRLLTHTSNYTIGTFLATLASIISFPFLTRIFTVQDYGVLNLVSTSLTVVVGVGKLGVQHAVVRFYSGIKDTASPTEQSLYRSTVFFGMLGTGLVAALVLAVGSQLVPSRFWQDERVAGLMLVASTLVVLRVVDSALLNLLRADERSGMYSAFTVAKRYGSFIIVVIVLLYISNSLIGFYYATVLAEAIAEAGLVYLIVRRIPFNFRLVSPSLFRGMVAFGLPMVGYEISANIADTGDRYVINSLLGPEPLGIYSAAYNLCDYVQNIFVASVGTAVVPLFVSLWTRSGAEATQRFIARTLHFYSALGCAVVAGMAAIGHDLLWLVASSKYESGSEIIPCVMAGVVLSGATTVVGAGLYIQRQTMVIMLLVTASAIVNILLNLILVPVYGIMGAAFATLLSNLLWLIAVHLVSNRTLPIVVPWGSTAKFLGMGLVMYAVLGQIHLQGHFVNLITKVAIGGLLFPGLVLAFDVESRQIVTTIATKVLARVRY